MPAGREIQVTTLLLVPMKRQSAAVSPFLPFLFPRKVDWCAGRETTIESRRSLPPCWLQSLSSRADRFRSPSLPIRHSNVKFEVSSSRVNLSLWSALCQSSWRCIVACGQQRHKKPPLYKRPSIPENTVRCAPPIYSLWGDLLQTFSFCLSVSSFTNGRVSFQFSAEATVHRPVRACVFVSFKLILPVTSHSFSSSSSSIRS